MSLSHKPYVHVIYKDLKDTAINARQYIYKTKNL